jgi:hypothetical protein
MDKRPLFNTLNSRKAQGIIVNDTTGKSLVEHGTVVAMDIVFVLVFVKNGIDHSCSV